MNIPKVEKVSGVQFREYFLAFLARNPHQRPFVTVFDVEHYTYCECFVSHDCSCGFALQDDEIISLFAVPGKGTDMLLRAKRSGFRVLKRAPWDETLAPDNWDYGRYGRPDVLWMRLPGPSWDGKEVR